MDSLLIKGGRVVDPSLSIDEVTDILIDNGKVVKVEKNIPISEAVTVVNADGLVVSPGFIDLHVHFRDPGQEWKEDIETGSQAAVAGGVTSVCCMANTDPVNDNPAVTRYIVEKAKSVGLCDVFPIGAITKGLKGEELAEIGLMVKAGIVAVSDDGETPKDAKVLRNAMDYARSLGIPVFTHSEDKTLSAGGHMNEGMISTLLGIPGMPAEAEEIGILRDLMVAKLTGAHIHICHVSTSNALRIIEMAKREGINVTCEITPHHFTLTEEAVRDFNTSAKMCPPLRTSEDVEACRRALKSGVADAIATDHAPHTEDEKMVEFCAAPFGIIGLQTMLPLTLELVRKGYLTLSQMVERLSTTPAKIIKRSDIGALKLGARANVTVFDPDEEYVFIREMVRSKSFNSPFLGWKLKGKVKMTFYNGKIVFKDL
ncbi:dihydroorotase [Desulfurobacterium pacificum]|uniref:Dihydroorotase n=1 Tax=Desulfurobacterium pacificum TaxID=240166 RepID=A0ABY1NGG0_9BACT|nr:dihydroorotase [Desulfurobacterium pacificum]SMP08172.1 dihydroorotase [Desulfurobacterium pacificum]